MILYAKNVGGLLEWSNKRILFDYLLSNSDYKGNYIIEIEKEKSRRSLNANAYLWGVVYELISKHTGHTSQELHEIYSRMFLKPKFITYKGKEIKLPTGTSILNKIQFGEYLDRVIAEASSMGIVIPEAVKESGDMPEYPVEIKNITAF